MTKESCAEIQLAFSDDISLVVNRVAGFQTTLFVVSFSGAVAELVYFDLRKCDSKFNVG